MGKNQELSFRYGSEARVISVATDAPCETLLPQSLPPLKDPASAVRAALADPIGTPPLRKILHAGERVAVLVNDITRRVYSEVFLPVLIDEMNACGIPDRDIFIVFALGLHRQQSAEERRLIVGEEVARRIALYDHDCRDRRKSRGAGPDEPG